MCPDFLGPVDDRLLNQSAGHGVVASPPHGPKAEFGRQPGGEALASTSQGSTFVGALRGLARAIRVGRVRSRRVRADDEVEVGGFEKPSFFSVWMWCDRSRTPGVTREAIEGNDSKIFPRRVVDESLKTTRGAWCLENSLGSRPNGRAGTFSVPGRVRGLEPGGARAGASPGTIGSMAIAINWGRHGQAVSPQPSLGDRPCYRVQFNDSRVQLADQQRERAVGQGQSLRGWIQLRRREQVQVD